MKLFNKLSRWIFSGITVLIIICMFPIVLCPMLWGLFAGCIILQFVNNKESIWYGRVLTVTLFLLVSFRIYHGYVTDFTIPAPDTLGFKFLLLAIVYGAGSLLSLWDRLLPKALMIIIAVVMAIIGLSIRNEFNDQIKVSFKESNPNSVLLSNFKSTEYLKRIKVFYQEGSLREVNGLMYYDTTYSGLSYSIIIGNRKEKNIPPIMSFSVSDTSGNVLEKVLFRYDSKYKYGFAKYTITPMDRYIKDSDSVTNRIEDFLDLVP